MSCIFQILSYSVTKLVVDDLIFFVIAQIYTIIKSLCFQGMLLADIKVCRVNCMQHCSRKILKNENGFTLIELLMVVTIVGILSGLSVRSFTTAKEVAAFSVAQATLKQARTAASAGQTNSAAFMTDGVPYTEFRTPADLSGDAVAREYLTGLSIPPNIVIAAEYRPECVGMSDCPVEYIQVNHCSAKKYVSFTRYGAGPDTLEEIPGAGCP